MSSLARVKMVRRDEGAITMGGTATRSVALLLLAVTVLVLVPSRSSGTLSTPEPLDPTDAHRAIVGYAPGAGTSVRAAIRSSGAGVIERHAPGSYFVVHGPPDLERWLDRIADVPGVRFAEPDHLVTLQDTLPDDPQWASLWGLQAIGAPAAWDVTTGSSDVVVAVVDTGIDPAHPDLAGRLWTNPGEVPANGVDDDGNGWVDDVHGVDCRNDDVTPIDVEGHGTHIAGTIGGAGDDGIGVTGVNWDVRLMALAIFSPAGSARISDIVQCIDYATAQGVRVSNHSYGGSSFSQALYEAFTRARSAGQLMVAAAGNVPVDAAAQPLYPAAFDLDNVISVAATQPGDSLASFSTYGVTTVDLGAPGVEIVSTVPGGYDSKNGTSMATPHVTGAAALLLSTVPNATYPYLRDTLLATVTPVEALAGKVVSGGRLDVGAALAAAAPVGPPVAVPPTPTIVANRVAGTGGANVNLRWTASDPDGVASYRLEVSTDGGATFAPISLSPTTLTTKTVWAKLVSPAYIHRVRGTDPTGSIGDWATADLFRLAYVQESAPTVGYVGPWSTASPAGALGGATRWSSTADASATVEIPTGTRAAGLVFARGPNRGKADVYLDGRWRATLDLYAAKEQARWIAFAVALDPLTAHAIEVRVLGKKGSASTGTRVDLDAVALLSP